MRLKTTFMMIFVKKALKKMLVTKWFLWKHLIFTTLRHFETQSLQSFWLLSFLFDFKSFWLVIKKTVWMSENSSFQMKRTFVMKNLHLIVISEYLVSINLKSMIWNSQSFMMKSSNHSFYLSISLLHQLLLIYNIDYVSI